MTVRFQAGWVINRARLQSWTLHQLHRRACATCDRDTQHACARHRLSRHSCADALKQSHPIKLPGSGLLGRHLEGHCRGLDLPQLPAAQPMESRSMVNAWGGRQGGRRGGGLSCARHLPHASSTGSILAALPFGPGKRAPPGRFLPNINQSITQCRRTVRQKQNSPQRLVELEDVVDWVDSLPTPTNHLPNWSVIRNSPQRLVELEDVVDRVDAASGGAPQPRRGVVAAVVKAWAQPWQQHAMRRQRQRCRCCCATVCADALQVRVAATLGCRACALCAARRQLAPAGAAAGSLRHRPGAAAAGTAVQLSAGLSRRHSAQERGGAAGVIGIEGWVVQAAPTPRAAVDGRHDQLAAPRPLRNRHHANSNAVSDASTGGTGGWPRHAHSSSGRQQGNVVRQPGQRHNDTLNSTLQITQCSGNPCQLPSAAATLPNHPQQHMAGAP